MTKWVIFLLTMITLSLPSAESAVPAEPCIVQLTDTAERLYRMADGIECERYILCGEKFYLEGNENSVTVDERIKEFTDTFSIRKCREIFDGARKNGTAEYRVDSAGTLPDGEVRVLTADDILSRNFSGFTEIRLFSVIRGKDMSFAAGGIRDIEANGGSAAVNYDALYFGDHNDGIEYEIEYTDKGWTVISPADRSGSYAMHPEDSVREYEFRLTEEDGRFKLDTFTLWY